MKMFSWIRQITCGHVFYLDLLKKTGENEDGNRRVMWPCEKCGKIFFAHCGLDISPKHGPTIQRERFGKDDKS